MEINLFIIAYGELLKMNKDNYSQAIPLLLITQSFPFGLAESSFLKKEIISLARYFSVHIISRNINDTQYVNVPNNVMLHRYNAKHNYKTVVLLLRALFSLNFIRELFVLLRRKMFSLGRLKKCLRVQMRTLHFASYLDSVRRQIDGPAILYSYWNDYACFAATLVKREKDFVVSRLHGGDLYELEINDRYQPYKCVYNHNVDLFSFIARMGLSYYNETYFNVTNKASINYLGVPEHSVKSIFSDRRNVKIVSFSYVRDIKRIDRIIDVLSNIDTLSVDWTHIGARYYYDQIRDYAKEKLDSKPNINYHFLGELRNEDALKYISNNEFDFLINVSSTEGLPMTMMEAFSMSIPVIGTKVGGVPEVIIHAHNGYLLDVDFKDEDLANILYAYESLPFSEKVALRLNAKNTWQSTFREESNYGEFAHLLISRFKEYEAKRD